MGGGGNVVLTKNQILLKIHEKVLPMSMNQMLPMSPTEPDNPLVIWHFQAVIIFKALDLLSASACCPSNVRDFGKRPFLLVTRASC